MPEREINPPEYTFPKCPVCGAEATTIYMPRNSNCAADALGCDNCIETMWADTWQEAFGYED